ncbi:hypothetical protein GC163_15205 [bacterium]|nr:hypothetical protein [bacterium]
MPTRRTSAVWLSGCLAVALLVRLATAVVVDQIVSATPGRICLIEGDASGYWILGERLARGESYELYDPPRRILRMPGFPILLAGCRLVFGDALFPTRCVLAVIGTLGCGCVYWLGRELVNETVGLVACGLVAVSPPLVVFSPLLLSETLFATAMVASLIPLARLVKFPADQKARIWLAIVAGSLLAVATYVRPTWLPIAAVGAGSIIIAARGRRAGWYEAGCLLLAFALWLTPWTVRNYRVCGHVVPTTLWVGASLYDGLNPEATGDSNMAFFDRENLLATMSEYEVDREYRRRAWDYAGQHPGRAIELAIIKAGRYWSPWPNAEQFDRPVIRWGLIAATVPMYLLALLGLWQQRRQAVFWLVTLCPALFFCLVHMLFVGSIRYRLPADMTLWIAAATGLVTIYQRWRGRVETDLQEAAPWAA